MRVLVVSLYALEMNTSVSKSSYNIIQGLIDCGNDVTILMPKIDSRLSYYDDTYSKLSAKVIRIPDSGLGNKIAVTANVKQNNKKNRLLDYFRTIYKKMSVFGKSKAYIKSIYQIDDLEPYYDIIISVSDPKATHLFTRKLIKKTVKCGKWIQHWGDPMALDISAKYAYPKFYIEYLEKKLIAGASKIVYVSPFTLEEQKKKYKKYAEKMEFVPLPCDVSTCSDETNDLMRRDRGLNVSYLGDYSSNIRNIMPLYKACSELPFVNLTVAGNSDLHLDSTENIKILPRISQKNVKKIEDKTDVIISVGNLTGTQIPGKIYYSASGNKHILVLLDGEKKDKMKEYIDSFDRYITCQNEEAAIRQILTELNNHNDVRYTTPERLKQVQVALDILA